MSDVTYFNVSVVSVSTRTFSERVLSLLSPSCVSKILLDTVLIKTLRLSFSVRTRGLLRSYLRGVFYNYGTDLMGSFLGVRSFVSINYLPT